MVGIPGCGKSTFCKKLIQDFPDVNISYISRDDIRFEMLQPHEDYFAHEDDVYSTFIYRIKKSLEDDKCEVIIADATHLNERARNKLLSQLPLRNAEIIPVFFKVPFEICLKRNNTREGRRKVPESAIQRMANTLTHPKFDKRFKYLYVWEVDENGQTHMAM